MANDTHISAHDPRRPTGGRHKMKLLSLPACQSLRANAGNTDTWEETSALKHKGTMRKRSGSTTPVKGTIGEGFPLTMMPEEVFKQKRLQHMKVDQSRDTI